MLWIVNCREKKRPGDKKHRTWRYATSAETSQAAVDFVKEHEPSRKADKTATWWATPREYVDLGVVLE